MITVRTTGDLGAPDDQFDWPFVDGMVRRMAMSYYKYGHMRTAAEDGVDLVLALEQRLALYKETGNREHLMDVANFAMIEFVAPSKEGTYYEAEDSDKSPGVPMRGRTGPIPGARPTVRQVHGKHSEHTTL